MLAQNTPILLHTEANDRFILYMAVYKFPQLSLLCLVCRARKSTKHIVIIFVFCVVKIPGATVWYRYWSTIINKFTNNALEVFCKSCLHNIKFEILEFQTFLNLTFQNYKNLKWYYFGLNNLLLSKVSFSERYFTIECFDFIPYQNFQKGCIYLCKLSFKIEMKSSLR